MKNTITRKIELRIIDEQKNNLTYKDVYKRLFEWQEIVFRAHNFVCTHLYIQKNLQEFFYFNEDFQLKLASVEQDPEGILNTSKRNTTYQVLSKKFKGDIPSDILANINSSVGLTFGKEQKEYFSGKRSLRSYKRNVPIPFSSKEVKNLTITEDEKNYEFDWFGLKFRTNFGKDHSGNKQIFDRGIDGEYKFCNSSFQVAGTKIFLLAVFQFESSEIKLNEKKSVIVRLGLENPLQVIVGKKTINIGTKEEFLHRRIQIKHAMYRTQAALKYNQGGKGRVKKLRKLEEWEKLEKNYVQTRLHTYSRELIKIALQEKAATIYIDDQPELMKSLESKIKEIQNDENLSRKEKNEQIENAKFVLSNWSYYGLLQKIEYKAKSEGITVVKI